MNKLWVEYKTVLSPSLFISSWNSLAFTASKKHQSIIIIEDWCLCVHFLILWTRKQIDDSMSTLATTGISVCIYIPCSSETQTLWFFWSQGSFRCQRKVNVNGKGNIYLPLHDSWYFKGTLSHSRKYKQSSYFQKNCIVFFIFLYIKNYIQGSAGIVFYVCYRTISVVPMGGAWKDNSMHTKYLKMPKINIRD